MPALDEDDRPKKKIAHEIGQDLTLLSVGELEERIRLLQDEIERLLRMRLVEAEQSLGLAREHLMAIDVKLDILEGAANVLDARTRAAISKHSGAGAPV